MSDSVNAGTCTVPAPEQAEDTKARGAGAEIVPDGYRYRPSWGLGPRYTKHLGLAVTQEMHNALTDLATRDGISLSDLVRQLLVRFLIKDGGPVE